jgi:predicted GNAT family acetyltransferase
MPRPSGPRPEAGYRLAVAEASPLEIVDVPDANRYEARVGETVAGWVDYRRIRGRLVALHTEVDPAFGGQGIASALVRRVIDDARAAGISITPRCPFFAAHFERHPEDADVVAAPPGG